MNYKRLLTGMHLTYRTRLYVPEICYGKLFAFKVYGASENHPTIFDEKHLPDIVPQVSFPLYAKGNLSLCMPRRRIGKLWCSSTHSWSRVVSFMPRQLDTRSWSGCCGEDKSISLLGLDSQY